MGKPRSVLSEKLHEICPNVYFQPPSNLRMVYPCIVYSLEQIDVKFANNGVYNYYDKYSLIYVTRDPDDVNVHKIAFLPLCSSNRDYSSDNLHHHAYTIYN